MACCQAQDRLSCWQEQPCLIVEIASASTTRIDGREKFLTYREIRALKDYLPIKHGATCLTLFTPHAAQTETLGIVDTLHQGSVGLTVTVADRDEVVELGEQSVSRPGLLGRLRRGADDALCDAVTKEPHRQQLARSARSPHPTRLPSLVVRPHPEHLDDLLLWQDLVHESMLDADPPGVRAAQVAYKFLEPRRRLEGVPGKATE